MLLTIWDQWEAAAELTALCSTGSLICSVNSPLSHSEPVATTKRAEHPSLFHSIALSMSLRRLRYQIFHTMCAQKHMFIKE